MLNLRTLGIHEARCAIAEGVAQAQRRGLTMAFVVADHRGAPIACERMDGAPARTLTHALRKAFTAAEMGRDTARFGKDLQDRRGDLDQWGNLDLTTLPGGCVVVLDGEVVGSVACGGAPTELDVEIARAMCAAALA
jgi:glc operon protein GlcG